MTQTPYYIRRTINVLALYNDRTNQTKIAKLFKPYETDRRTFKIKFAKTPSNAEIELRQMAKNNHAYPLILSHTLSGVEHIHWHAFLRNMNSLGHLDFEKTKIIATGTSYQRKEYWDGFDTQRIPIYQTFIHEKELHPTNGELEQILNGF